MRGGRRVPISAISATTRIDCKRLYEIIMPVPASADVAELLTPVVRAFEADRFKFRRSGRYSDDPNRWNIIETYAGGACWGAYPWMAAVLGGWAAAAALGQ